MKRADPSRLRKKALKPRPILSRADLEYHLSVGGKVCKSLPRTEGETLSWFDPATNRTVGTRVIAWAIAEGKLRATGDGLFGESQTYERAA